MTALVRFLKVLLALLLASVAVLWFAARRGNRGSIEREITIARPAPVIFRWISSEEQLRRWISDLVELRKEEAAPPRNASYRLVERIAGHTVAMRLEVLRAVPNQELGLQFASLDVAGSGFSGAAQFKLFGDGEYTRLVLTSHAEFRTLSDRIAEPLLTLLSDRKMKDDLARLKLLLEAEPAAPAPRPAARAPKAVR